MKLLFVEKVIHGVLKGKLKWIKIRQYSNIHTDSIFHSWQYNWFSPVLLVKCFIVQKLDERRRRNIRLVWQFRNGGKDWEPWYQNSLSMLRIVGLETLQAMASCKCIPQILGDVQSQESAMATLEDFLQPWSRGRGLCIKNPNGKPKPPSEQAAI